MRTAFCLALCLLSAFALPQDVSTERTLPACSYRSADIHLVLADLFRKSHTHFVIDTRVQGRVSLRLPAMPLEKSVQTILLSSHCTYRVEDGCYDVIPREEAQKPDGAAELGEQPPADVSARIVAPVVGVQMDLRLCLASIFEQTRTYYVIGTGVAGSISADLPALGLRSCLNRIGGGGASEFRYVNGAFVVSRAPTGPGMLDG